MATKLKNNGQKLAIAGATTLLVEPALALAHQGGIGIIVGLAAGAVAYWVADEMGIGQATAAQEGEEEPSSPDTPEKQVSGKLPLYKRMLSGKSVRGEQEETENADSQGTPQAEPLALNPSASFQFVPENKLLKLGRFHGTENRFDPPMNGLLGRGGLLTGAPGSGKSNIIELLMTSASRCQISALLIDFKREFYPLLDVLSNGVRAGHPDYESQAAPGYNGVTAENAASFAADMMEFGFQVIFDVQSYRDQDELAKTLDALFTALMDWSQQVHDDGETPPPCLVITDEAHNFVPEQRTKSAFSMEEASFKLLKKAYSWIGTAGRSYGYTVIHATQRIANIATWAIAGLQVKVVMCHVEENDLNRCEKEIGKKAVQRDALKRLPPGQGYVLGFTPDPVLVQFDQCPTRHVSITPTVEHAHARHKKRSLNEQYQTLHQQRKTQLATRRSSTSFATSQANSDPTSQAVNNPLRSPSSSGANKQTELRIVKSGNEAARSGGEVAEVAEAESILFTKRELEICEMFFNRNLNISQIVRALAPNVAGGDKFTQLSTEVADAIRKYASTPPQQRRWA